uniref:Proliferating cell nuclear antigen n=1 Tax=Lingulaulax polyedra TaxID=160621 RepID=A0A516AG28_LINPO|nr:proliferating cell nuclear antigen [Lingulodinium polyedra]
MNVDSLAKILKMCDPSYSLKLWWRGGAGAVSFQCENGGKGRIAGFVLKLMHVVSERSFQRESGEEGRFADFKLKLMHVGSEHMEIPEQHYKVSAKLPSAEFQKICRDLKEFGETMQVKASKEGITFSVQGDVGAGNVMLKPRESEKPEERVSLTVHEPVTATFALRYLVNFAKAAPLSGAVELGLGPDAPLLVKYDLERNDNGYMQFYLAPKIDE